MTLLRFLCISFLCIISGAASLQAGSNTELLYLNNNAGNFSPPFSSSVASYTQTSDLADLILWPMAKDVEAVMEVRANSGAWQPLAGGSTVSIGHDHGLLIRQNGTLAVWGTTFDGVMVAPPGLTNLVSVAAGYSFGLALRRNGTVAGWGYEPQGQVSGPVSQTGVVAIYAGTYFSYVLKNDGTLRSWGNMPVPAGLTNVVSVADNGNYAFAARRDGSVVAWDASGFLPNIVPAGLSKVVSLATSYGGYLALRSDGTVMTWNVGTATTFPPPAGLRDVVAVTAGEEHFAVLKKDGRVTAWGVGPGATVPAGLADVVALTASLRWNTAVKRDGTIVRWGALPTDGPSPPAGAIAARLPGVPVLPLSHGGNTVEVRLTPPAGGVARTYTINVNRESNAKLALIETSIGTLTPAFSADRADYTLSLPYANDSIRFLASPQVTGTVVQLGNSVLPADTLSPPRALVQGANLFRFTVVSELEDVSRLYSVTVTREAPQTNNNLRALAHSLAPLVPDFSPATLSYSTAAPVRQPRLVVRPRVASLSAVLEVRSNAGPWVTMTTGNQSEIDGLATVLRSDGSVVAWNPRDGTLLPPPKSMPRCAAVAPIYGGAAAVLSDGKVVTWGSATSTPKLPQAGVTGVVELASVGSLTAALKGDGTVTVWDSFNGLVQPGFTGFTDLVSISGSELGGLLGVRRNGSLAVLRGDTVGLPVLNNAVSTALGFGRFLALRRDGSVAQWGYEGGPPPGLPPALDVAAEWSYFFARHDDGTLTGWGELLGGAIPSVPAGLGPVQSLRSSHDFVFLTKADGAVRMFSPDPLRSTAPAVIPPGLLVRTMPETVTLPLKLGANSVQVRVTAENGIGRTYAVAIIREANLDLAALTPDYGTIAPALTPGGSHYTLTLPYTRSSLTLTPRTADDTVVTLVNGTLLPHGMGRNIPLNVGTNTITLTLTDEDGVSLRTVTLDASRLAANPRLSFLTSGNGPVLTQGVTEMLDTAQKHRLPALTVWPRQSAAGASLEARANGGPWQRLSSGPLLALGGGDYYLASFINPFLIAVQPNGTVTSPTTGSWGGVPFDPAGLTNVVSVAAGAIHGAMLHSDGSVTSRGYGPAAVTPPGLHSVAAIAATGTVTLAVLTDGTVTGWGESAAGLLTIPPGLNEVVALEVDGGSNAGACAVALRRDGTIVAWGCSAAGPMPVPAELQDAVAVTLTGGTGAALLSTGRVLRWIISSGNPLFDDPSLSGVVALSRGVALRRDGGASVVTGSWGFPPAGNTAVALENGFLIQANGQAYSGGVAAGMQVAVRPSWIHAATRQGINLFEFRVREADVEIIHRLTIERGPQTDLRFLAASAGSLMPAFDRAGRSYALPPQAGPDFKLWPAPVNPAAVVEVRANGGPWRRTASGPSLVTGFQSGGSSSFQPLLNDGQFYSWSSALTTNNQMPGPAVSVARGSNFNLAVLNDGTPAWSSSSYNDLAGRPPGPLRRLAALSAGDAHVLALFQDGRVQAWGRDTNGQAAPPPGLADAVQVCAGPAHSLALRANGSVVAWGLNTNGQTSVPAGLSGVVALTAGSTYSAALKSDGTVTAWGAITVPPGVRDAIAITGYPGFVLALAADGTVPVSHGTPAWSAHSGLIDLGTGYGTAFALRDDGGVVNQGIAAGSSAVNQSNPVPGRPRCAVLPLQMGVNAVEVRVTEPDGTASATTTLNVTRLPTAGLSSLRTPAATLTPSFAPDNSEYSAEVPYAMSSLEVQARTVERGAVMRINGTPVTGGSAIVSLAAGVNVITLSVTAEDGVTTQSWQLSITRRPPSRDASLAILTDSVAPISPAFEPAVHDYTHDYRFANAALRALPAHRGATVEVRFNDGNFVKLGQGTRLAMSDTHAVALRSDGTVAAWGNNQEGQTNVPAGLTGVVSVAAGYRHSVALRHDGTVVAWGRNLEGQCRVPEGLNDVAAISSGQHSTTALRHDGRVVVWGLGTQPPADLNDAVSVIDGWNHFLAIRRNGTVVSWGGGSSLTVPAGLTGVTAVGAGYDYATVIKQDGTLTLWGISSAPGLPAASQNGFAFLDPWGACAVHGTGSVTGWTNSSGSNNVPANLTGVISAVGGRSYGLAVKADQSLVPWGNVAAPPAGLAVEASPLFLPLRFLPGLNTVTVRVRAEDGVTEENYTLRVQRLPNPAFSSLSLTEAALTPAFSPAVMSFAASLPYAVATARLTVVPEDSTSTVTVNGLAAVLGVPFAVPFVAGANVLRVRITAEDGITTEERTVTVTRATADEGLELKFLGCTSAPVMQAFTPARLDYNIAAAPATLTFWPRPALTSSQLSWRADGGAWEQLNASGMCSAAGTSGVTLAVRTDRTLSVWGSGVTSSSASLPQGLTDVVAVAAGNLHAMALTGDGRIIVWGDTSNGQNVVPVVPGGFAAMASGRRHCLALTAAGIVRAWGQNTNSQSTVPAGLPPISALAGGNSHSLALSRDGRVFSWGSMAQSTVPAGLPPVVAIAAGDSFNAVLKHDGTVTAWGDNAYGQSTIPAGLTGVTAIACGGRHVVVLKQDGSVVTWGDNTFGQRTVPAGLNNVAAVNAGGSLSLAVRKTGVVTIWGTNGAGALNIPAGLLVPALPSHVAVSIHAGSNAINFKLEPPDASASRLYSVTARGSFLPLYTAWAATVFPAGTPAAQSAPNADPDNDGLLSGIEYLLSTNPRTANPSPLAIRTEGDDFLVTFPRRSGVPDGLETVQVSVNPGAAWTLADTSAITRTDNGPGQPQTVTVRLSHTAGSMFVRLKADF